MSPVPTQPLLLRKAFLSARTSVIFVFDISVQVPIGCMIMNVHDKSPIHGLWKVIGFVL